MEEGTPTFQQKSSVKLIKIAKGYRWEVKVYAEDLDEIMDGIKKLDYELKTKYGE